jgi:hypothetical protein
LLTPTALMHCNRNAKARLWTTWGLFLHFPNHVRKFYRSNSLFASAQMRCNLLSALKNKHCKNPCMCARGMGRRRDGPWITSSPVQSLKRSDPLELGVDERSLAFRNRRQVTMPTRDDGYQAMAEECFRRAREAESDRERQGYLELAQTGWKQHQRWIAARHSFLCRHDVGDREVRSGASARFCFGIAAATVHVNRNARSARLRKSIQYQKSSWIS